MLHKLLLYFKSRKKKPECDRCRWMLRGMQLMGYTDKVNSNELKIMLDYWHEQHS